MTAERQRTFEEKHPDFNIKDFVAGDHVAIFQTNQWLEAELGAPPRIEHGQVVIDLAGGGQLESAMPLKKIVLPAPAAGGGPNIVTIDGRDYSYRRDDYILDEDGEAIYNLIDVASGDARLGIKAEILRNLSEARGMKQDVEDLIVRIERVASIKRKELLAKHTELVKKVDKLLLEFGSPADWEDWDGKEVEIVGKKLEQTRQEILVEVIELEREIERIERELVQTDATNKEVEIGKINADRLEYAEGSEIKEQENAAKGKTEKEVEAWKKNKKNWEEYEKGDGGGKGKGKASKADKDAAWNASHPGEPIPNKPDEEQPKLKEIDKEAAVMKAGWELFNSLVDTHPLRQEVEKRRKELAVKSGLAGGDFPFVDPARTKDEKRQVREFQARTVAIMKEVITEWKNKTAEKFDFNKEKKELEDKLLELTKRIAKYPPDKNLEARVKATHGFLLHATKERTTRDELLVQWREMGKIELAVYEKEISAKSKPEVAERNIDIPQDLLTQIFAARKDKVQGLMKDIYTHSLAEGKVVALEAIRGSLKSLFDVPPNAGLLMELKRHGIKSWENFQKLLDGGLGERLVAVLNVMAQEHLKKEVAKNTTAWDKTKALKWHIGLQVASSVALVSGAAVAASALFATGGLAGVGLAAAAGGAGGLVRGLVNKVGFGSKSWKGEKEKKLKDLEDAKKEEFINHTLESGFGNVGGVDQFQAHTNAEFSAIMAQCLREVSKVGDYSEKPEEFERLSADAKRLYVAAIKNAEMAGSRVDAEQKKAFVLALLDMQAKSHESIRDAAANSNKGAIAKLAGPNSDPMTIKILTGETKALSGNMESTGGALTCSSIMGAGMGVAFFSENTIARLIAGGKGGILMGYQYGEGKRLKSGMEKGRKEVLADFGQAKTHFENLSTLTPDERAQFADEIIKLKSALRGGKQSKVEGGAVEVVKEEKEQWCVLALQDDSVLRKQVENLVYEAEKGGVLVEQDRRRDFGAALSRLEEHKKKILKQCEKSTIWQKIKRWGARNVGSIEFRGGVKQTLKSAEAGRLVWMVAGAGAGAITAWAVGAGIQEVREWFGISGSGAHTEQTQEQADATTVDAPKEGLFSGLKKLFGFGAGAVEPHAGSGGQAGGHEPVPTGKGTELHQPEPTKPESVVQHEAPKTESTVIEQRAPTARTAAVAAEAAATMAPEAPANVGFDFHNEHNPDMIRFSSEHHLTNKEFAYLQELTDKYPQLNNPESLDKILHSAEFADGKPCMHPEIYKGTINTAIESAADAKLSTLDGILEGGHVEDGVRFLQEQNFNAHSLKNLGITGLPKAGSANYDEVLRQKFTNLVEQYQAGDKSTGKHLFDAFRHDMNRAQAPFMKEVRPGLEVLPVKGLKGMNPRVWGTDESGEVLVGQAKGYTPRVTHLPTQAERLEHDVYHTEKATSSEMFHDVMRNPNKVISDLPPEVEARLGPNARITEVVPAPSRGPDAALIKTDNGEWHAVRITETTQGSGGTIGTFGEKVYHISALEPVSDAVASQLGAGHGAGAVAGGLETAMAHGGAGHGKTAALDFSHPKFDPNSPEVKAAMATKTVSSFTPTRNVGGGGTGRNMMWQLPKAPTHSGETALTAEQQRTADYLEQTGSTAKGRTVVKDGTGTHWTEERVGAKVGKAPVAKPEQQAQPAPETGEFAPASVDAKYSQAIIEIGNNWDLEINNMQVGGELTKGQLLDELHRYLNNAALTHTELNVTEAGGDFNTMVDNMDARLRAHLSPELDFVLNHHPQGDSPLVLAPDGEDSNVIKFMHNGKEYVLQDPDRVFKMVDGKLFVAEEYGDFSPATCGVDEDDNPVVEPTEDAIKMAASQ